MTTRSGIDFTEHLDNNTRGLMLRLAVLWYKRDNLPNLFEETDKDLMDSIWEGLRGYSDDQILQVAQSDLRYKSEIEDLLRVA